MEDMPDLSHLTPEERRHIEGVIMRQRQEDEYQNEIMRRKQNEVQVLEDTISRARNERLQAAGRVDLDATCEICLKTKFADGVGHICNYCSVRCCARCGGKVSLRSNKIIWVCILCRKKQELLSKSGQWMMKSNLSGADGNMLRRMQEDMQGMSLPQGLLVDPSQDKRPKLERAHSAVEKENLPLLQRSSSLLRRQYSHQEQIQGRRFSTSDSGVEMSVSPHSRTLPTPHVAPYQTQQPPRHPAAYPEDDPNIYRGELDGLMRQNSSYQQQRQRPMYQQDPNLSMNMGYGHPQSIPPQMRPQMQQHHPQQPPQQPMGPSSQSLHPGHAHQQGQQRSFSSSEEERSTPECASDEPDDHHREHELYDARGGKPSVLVTSPGSPDLYSKGRACSRQFRHPATGGTNSVGGRLQLKLSFDASSHQLVVTLVCASGLIPRSNGQSRSSYAKMYLLPDKSENSKRRTKTLANTNDPRWDQTFVYGGVRWSDLRQRSLEITIWDYGRYGANDFLGEVLVNLAASSLNDEPEWHYLMAHEEHRQAGYYQDPSDDVTTPGDCHLSPPSTTSRLSDSDTSECDITDCDGSREHRRTADGASISSIGSSSSHYSSPPPEKELCVDGEHRSRRDMSPQGRKRAALMGSREQPASVSGYHHYRKEDPHRGAMLSHRSHSAAPMDSPMLHYRGRSQSPTGHRSLSPPDRRGMPYSSGYMSARFASRSATATPTGSPKKRQLPQIPATLNAALKERVVQDFEDRAKYLRHRHRPLHSIYRGSIGGWDRRYSRLSDTDLPSMGHEPHSLSHSHIHRMHRSRRGQISPEKDVLADLGDSDMESIASVTSSAFSTQSERPRGFRSIDYQSHSSSYEKPSRYASDEHERGSMRDGAAAKRGQFSRSFSNADAPTDEKGDGNFSDTGVNLHVEESERRARKSSPSSKSGSGSSSGGGSAAQYQSGMGKKSNSTSQLSATGVGEEGRKRRLGFGKKGKSSFTVHRSEEVLPEQQQQQQQSDAASGRSGRQPSSASSDGEPEGSIGDPGSWSPSLRMAGEGGELTEFIEGLGPGQLVGRQVLGAPSLGDIQLNIRSDKGCLEVEVVRARDLQPRSSGAKPAPYVKVYLVNGKKCIAKQKTGTARKTLEPFYSHKLYFRENYKGCILQVTVWGDYGRLEGKKVFMGVAQIMLDNLNLSKIVEGWYKLFGTTSLVSGPPSLGLSRRSSAASLESLRYANELQRNSITRSRASLF